MNSEDRLRELKDPERWMNVRLPKAPAPALARTRLAPARVAQLGLAYTLAILAVVGIAAALGLVAGKRPVPPAVTPTGMPTATASPSPSSSTPSFIAEPGAGHTYLPSQHPDVCALAQLQTESSQDGGGAAGTYYQSLYVRNSGADCYLPPDAVSVGGGIATLSTPGRPAAGIVLPAYATASLNIGAGFLCQPAETTNIDARYPVQPIVLHAAGGSRVMTAKYPRTACNPPSVDGELGVPDGTGFASSPSGLDATIERSVVSEAGPVGYDVTLQDNGTEAVVLTSCPNATEVLSDGLGEIVTRAIALRCVTGATMQPRAPATVAVLTTIPKKGEWTITWFLGAGSRTTSATAACTLDSLSFQTQGHGGGMTGNWIELLTVRNAGRGDCLLPASAFVVGARHARAGQAANVAGFRLRAGSSTLLELLAATTCPVGGRTSNLSPRGPYASVSVRIDGRSRTIGSFPELHCSDPFVDK